jgi:hypothetical protein
MSKRRCVWQLNMLELFTCTWLRRFTVKPGGSFEKLSQYAVPVEDMPQEHVPWTDESPLYPMQSTSLVQAQG